MHFHFKEDTEVELLIDGEPVDITSHRIRLRGFIGFSPSWLNLAFPEKFGLCEEGDEFINIETKGFVHRVVFLD